MTSRFIGSGRLREGGFAATHRQDFRAHTEGGDWRHLADQTDMNPAITTDNNIFNAPTVQTTLEKFATFLNTTGQGFISIGDGYDTQHADFIVGSGDDIASAFNDAFLHPRLTNGGVILVKAGTYRLKTTVTVPPGFIIMGELAGTIIQGEVIEQPMFIISSAIDRPQISSDSIIAQDPLDKNEFFNIILADNLDGYVNSGDPCMTTVPMIKCQTGSYLTCAHTAFLGKMGTLGAGPGFGRTKTLYAAGFANASSYEGTLIFDNCTFDGLVSIVKYEPGNINDKLIINQCKVRCFGTEALADSTDPTKNCFVLATGTMRISITNNTLIGTDGNSYIFAVVTFSAGTPIISIVNNSGTIAVPLVYENLINNNGSGTWVQNIVGNLFNDKGDGALSIGNNILGIASNNSGSIILQGNTGILLLQGADVFLTAIDDMTISSGDNISISTAGVGDITITSADNISISTAGIGDITITSADDISVTGADNVTIRSDNTMSVTSADNLTIASNSGDVSVSGEAVSITANVTDIDIDSSGGDVSITALGGSINVSAPSTNVTSEVILSSIGRVRYRVTYGTDADSTYSITTTDILVALAATITAGRDYTISNTGANVGSIIECINLDGTFSITLKRADTTTITILEPAGAGSLNYAKLCYFDAGSGDEWSVLNRSVSVSL